MLSFLNFKIKSTTNIIIILFQLQIYQIDKNGYNLFCNETLHLHLMALLKKEKKRKSSTHFAAVLKDEASLSATGSKSHCLSSCTRHRANKPDGRDG